MTHIHVDDGTITVHGTRQKLVYEPRLICVLDHDGGTRTTIAHESHDAEHTISSVWATDLGDCYVEVVYPGDGPQGGELVVVVPADNAVIVGDLMAAGEPSHRWAAALDVTLALTDARTVVFTADGPITREQLDEAHQHMLEKTLG